MKFGLVGTGYWAETVHGAVLASHPGVELTGVWGRDPDKATKVAASLGTSSYTDFDRLLGDVEALSFAVAPEAQATLATAAARAGKHLLLDKPLATSAEEADLLVRTVEGAGVSSVVFFTLRFAEVSRTWLEQSKRADWEGGWSRFIVAAFGEGSPYAASPWRHTKGALWDVGPHALSVLIAALGPITAVSATGGRGDLVHLVLEHDGGATSTATLTLDAPEAAITVETALWGPSGLTTLPSGGGDPKDAYATALEELMTNVQVGRRDHPCDVHFGADVVKVLAEAEAQLGASRPA